jgi:acetyl esterase
VPTDPDLARVLDGMERDGLSPLYLPGQPEASRERGVQARARHYPPLRPAVATVEDLEIPGPAGLVPVRVYEPLTPRPRPVLVYLHGGGFMIGDIGSHDGHARRVADRVGATVVNVGYRLAPEHPFPAGYDDCLAAVLWAASQQRLLGGDGRVAVGGDSAGGNLAAALCLELRDRGVALAAQFLLYPVVDLTAASDEDMSYLHAAYLGGRAELGADPRVSPIAAPDLSGLPPAVIGVAEYDELRGEGSRYAAALRAAGVDVIFHPGPGMIHGFFGMGGVSPAADRISDELCAHLKTLLDAQSGSAPAISHAKEGTNA